MSYLLFLKERNDFDDGEGNGVSLGEHLDYVASGGTPDCWASVEGSRHDAFQEARSSGLDLYIVCEHKLRVVGQVSAPKALENECELEI